MQLKSEFDKLFEDLKEDDKTCEMEGAEVFLKLEAVFFKNILKHQDAYLAWFATEYAWIRKTLVDTKMECYI